MKNKPLIIRNSCKTRNELSLELGISLSSLYRRLKDLNIVLPRALITPEQQAEIYRCLGYSYTIEKE
jgi:hypothetical protein